MTSAPCKNLISKTGGLIRGYLQTLLYSILIQSLTQQHTAPHKYPMGIEYVIVNGKLTVDKAKHLGTKAGMVIKIGV